MGIVDYIKDRRNKILVASPVAVGLIIAAAAGINALTPAYQVRDSNGQVVWGVNLRGDQTGSGILASKTLANCNTIDGTSTGMLVCGTDEGGAGAGLTFAVAEGIYVNQKGDTMTGALTINVTGGTRDTIGLKIINTMSGAHIHAQQLLTSSGAGIFTGNLTTKATLSGAGLTVMNGNSYFLGNLGIGKSTAPRTRLEFVGTASGSILYATQTIRSSGSIVLEGMLSGSMIMGFGLNADCDGSANKITWDAPTQRFKCEADQTGSGLPAGGSSGQILINGQPGSAYWGYEQDVERFTVYGANAKIYKGSGADFISGLSGAIVGAQIMQRVAASGITMNIYVNNQKITSTALTTDNRERSSTSALIPMVIDTTKNRFNQFAKLRFDVSGTGAVAGTGLNLILLYQRRSH